MGEQLQSSVAQQHLSDVVIVGAGPAGLTLALCLAEQSNSLQITVIDQQARAGIAQPEMDGRDIAMNHMTRSILQRLNVWQRLPDSEIHPLKEAKVSDGESPYALHFQRHDDAVAPLGYLVANHQIRTALYQQVCEHDNIELLTETQVENLHSNAADAIVEVRSEQGHSIIRAALVVAADSRFSVMRRMMGISAKMKDYGRVMMVCNMEHELSHQNTAQECFQYGRTCAILPLGPKRSSIVITTPAHRSSELSELDDEGFALEAESMLGNRLGKMKLVTDRFSYPLVGVMSQRFIGQRFALIGDAAVGMHPVTAHGYNLGVRSADTLASQIIKAERARKDIASQWVLGKYEVRHKLLATPIYEGTNAVVQLFTDDNPVAKVARKVALRFGNNFHPFKRLVTQRLIQE